MEEAEKQVGFTEESIVDRLRTWGNHEYFVPNCYIFGQYESDVLIVKPGSGYCYEIEIKISKQDFKNEFENKKVRHEILSKGSYTGHFSGEQKEVPELWRPNKFFFCAPAGLLGVDDIPCYAGLIEVTDTGHVYTKKNAPWLHKTVIKPSLEKRLCKKFWYYWRESDFFVYKRDQEIKRLNNKIKQLEHELSTITG